MVNLKELYRQQKLFDNKYLLKSKLGSGGFSEVWLAHDVVAKIDVALKIYTQTGELDEDGRNMFREEFATVCNFNHTNILRPFSYGILEKEVHDNTEVPYIVLPFCKSGSASKLINNISEEEVWRFIYDVASGLSYIHSQECPVVHQDIKPANVLIDAGGQFLITDFGISTKLHRTLSRKAKDSGNEGSGTLPYMAPERFGANASSLISNDIWSLGATLYELMTGNLPFGEYGGLTQSKEHSPRPIEGKYSKELKDLVYKCLSEKPYKRPCAEEIVNAVLERKLVSPKSTQSVWRRIIPIAAILFLFILSIISFQVYQKYEEEKIEEARLAHNDSIALLRMTQADNLIIKERKNTDYGKSIGRVKENNLIEATVLYDSALSLECTDTMKKHINEHKQRFYSFIDSVKNYFVSQEQHYRDIGADNAAEIFVKRQKTLENIK